jgi:hypothetical protein
MPFAVHQTQWRRSNARLCAPSLLLVTTIPCP